MFFGMFFHFVRAFKGTFLDSSGSESNQGPSRVYTLRTISRHGVDSVDVVKEVKDLASQGNAARANSSE